MQQLTFECRECGTKNNAYVQPDVEAIAAFRETEAACAAYKIELELTTEELGADSPAEVRDAIRALVTERDKLRGICRALMLATEGAMKLADDVYDNEDAGTEDIADALSAAYDVLSATYTLQSAALAQLEAPDETT